MSTTIKDVAKLAGVAPSTVSRVLSGSNRISQRTKERVQDAIEKLNYHRNYNAHSLVGKGTNCLGVAMPISTEQSFANPFFSEVIRGISNCANEQQFALLLSTGTTTEEKMNTLRDMVLGRRVDGVICLYSKENDPVLELLRTNDMPAVIVGNPFDDAKWVPYVDNDNVQTAVDATQHLIDLGHERIGFIGGLREFAVTKDRVFGYEQAMQEARLPIDHGHIIFQPFLHEGGYRAVASVFARPNPPSAFVVADDFMALGVLQGLHEIGIRIPEQISIVSINDFFISRLASPALTTINIGIYELGYTAAEKILRWIQTGDTEATGTIIPHHLIVRQTTAPTSNKR